MLSTGKRRGPKPKGTGSDVVVHLDDALNAIAASLERSDVMSSDGLCFEHDKDRQTMRTSARQIRILAHIAKSMRPNGYRAEASLRKL